MNRWSTQDMPVLHGRVALVTGANSGLGLETARALAAKGAHVVLACRGAAKAEAAMADIRATCARAELEFLPLDLAELASIRTAAEVFKSRHTRLDILCNNAGVMGLPYGRTRDGFEMLFGTNHLGHFALTGLLFDTIRATPGARIVSLASLAHRRGELPLADLHWERRPYSKAGAYGQSKLANLSFALELDRRLRSRKLDVLSVAAHPGYSATNIVFGSNLPLSIWRRVWNAMAAAGNALLAQTAAAGALPTLYAASADDVQSGEYFGPGGLIEFRGNPRRVRCTDSARDPELAAGLWAVSQEMTGVRFLS